MDTKYKLTDSQIRAVGAMKRQGFTHAKVELEADLGRGGGGDSDEDYTCEECDQGYNECNECYGAGVWEHEQETDRGRTVSLTELCDSCDGEGEFQCSYCDGDYERSGGGYSGYSNESTCHKFILNHVSPAARQALSFSKFYYDGSVDSELTFTMPIDQIHFAVEFVDAFQALADEIGNGIDSSGAGMHLSVLTQSYYPSSNRLDTDKLANFTTEVTKLLPALYFVASPDHASRGLNYRPPKIASDKYAAISTHNNTCLEYRIFETCYQRPLALLENFEVIANTLKFYSVRKLKGDKPKLMLPEGHGVARFFQTPEALKALNFGLKYLKVGNKTITELKAERGFKTTAKSVKVKAKIMEAEHKLKYEQYCRDYRAEGQRLRASLRHDYDTLHRAWPTEAEIQAGHGSFNYQLWHADTEASFDEFFNGQHGYGYGEPLPIGVWLANTSTNRYGRSYQLA